jgi:hypothetical protein
VYLFSRIFRSPWGFRFGDDSRRSVMSALVSRRRRRSPRRAVRRNRVATNGSVDQSSSASAPLGSLAHRLGRWPDASRTRIHLVPPSPRVAPRRWLHTPADGRNTRSSRRGSSSGDFLTGSDPHGSDHISSVLLSRQNGADSANITCDSRPTRRASEGGERAQRRGRSRLLTAASTPPR